MFKSARIKLTAAFIGIVMLITLFFSSVFYAGTMNTARGALAMHERRIEERIGRLPNSMPPNIRNELTNEAISQIKTRTITLLAILNVIILFISGSFGYFFSKLALDPIEKMTKKQKKFVEDAAHELKTPLTAMKTQFEVGLRNKKLSTRNAKEILESAVEEVDSLTLLTNSMLKQSTYQESKEKKKEIFDLDHVIKAVTKKLEEKAKEKKLKINIDSEATKIKANKEGIKELITILVDNAIKFNKENGHINIIVETVQKDVIIKVSDGGIGINEKDLPHVFDRFYKADRSRSKDNYEGFGLGLSIAKEIVEAHKGTISVESQKGKETTFTIKLPKNC